MTSRITEAFAAAKASGRTAIIPYVTAGFPERDATPGIVEALVRGGADLIELGVPFSDPIADGVAIQRSGQRALANGVTLECCLEIARACRERVSVPLLLMGYYNPFLQYGLERFCRDAVQGGVDGIIVVDLPPEEATDVTGPAAAQGLDVVFLAATSSSEQRLEQIGRHSRGFVYCVTVRGVTGARASLPSDLPAFLGRVRRHTDLPIAAGFGVSRAEHVREIGRHADGAAVGSALVALLEDTPKERREEAAERFVRELAGGAAQG